MDSVKKLNKQIILLEIFNSISHGFGAAIGILFLVLMIIKSSKTGISINVLSHTIYGSCFIFMFLSSCIYHATIFTKLKDFFRIFDHSAIFLFIAGSYTPIIIDILEGKTQILFLSLIWIIAMFGFIFKILTYGRYDKYIKTSIIIYIFMGWLAIFLIKPMFLMTSPEFLYYLIVGGLMYTIGTYFYKNTSNIYNHLIWHFFVLAAATLQFIAIYLYL